MTHCQDWMTAISTSSTDYETLKHYADCGIKAVELSVRWQDCDAIDWQGFRENADRAGIVIWSFHLPFAWHLDMVPDEEKRRKALAYQLEMIDKATAIGIRRFVTHTGSEPIPDEERSLWMEASKKSLRELAAYAADKGAVVCVENLPRSCLGHNVEEMLELTSADERLRVCFDVNHLCSAHQVTHQQFVEGLGHLIETVHMSDFDFVDEKHFFPGVGMIDWKGVVEALEGIDYAGPFLYEGGFGPSYWMPEAPYGRVEDAHERHMRIKELTGKDYVGWPEA